MNDITDNEENDDQNETENETQNGAPRPTDPRPLGYWLRAVANSRVSSPSTARSQ